MINPDRVARAARRLAAKMVADQATDLMVSVVGLTGDLDDLEPTEQTATVIVARGAHAARINDWIDSQSKTVTVEVVSEDPAGYCSKHKQRYDPAGCCGECERDGWEPEDD